jgi:glycosyltransferase involved in cell wall biosynthesis
VLVAEGTEHCRLVRDEGVGACADGDSPTAVAAALAGLLSLPSAARDELRRHCRSVALARYTWEAQQGGLIALYRRLDERR